MENTNETLNNETTATSTAETTTNTEETTAATEPVIELSETEQLQNKVNEINDKYMRMYAEYDNFKRRTIKERQDYIATAGKEMVVSMINVLDDFDRAAKAIEAATDIDAVKEGIKLIHNKVRNALIQKGLEPLESIGLEFNSDIHEAITTIPAPSPKMKGKVIDELEKGYNLNGKPLRVAKVVVGA
jgi:molecular chaperone GrpE